MRWRTHYANVKMKQLLRALGCALFMAFLVVSGCSVARQGDQSLNVNPLGIGTSEAVTVSEDGDYRSHHR